MNGNIETDSNAYILFYKQKNRSYLGDNNNNIFNISHDIKNIESVKENFKMNLNSIIHLKK